MAALRTVLPLLSLLALTAACSSAETPPTGGASGSAAGGGGAGGAGGAGQGGGNPEGPPHCAPDTVDVTPAGAGAFTILTTHYQLYAEAPQADAVEMGRMLEAAYDAFQAYFEATPPLAAGARLAVKFYADEPSWAAGLMADGIPAPTEGGGYYAPSTSTAYLYKQGNPYYTHILLLHEATHQFHLLSRTKGQGLPFWYLEGVAEYLSRHDWDTKCLRLGVVSLLSWEDLPAQALAEDMGAGVDLPGIVSGSVKASRDISWAIYQLLDNGDGGAHRSAFKAYRDAVDANQMPAPSFAALVGDPAALEKPLEAWLPTGQEPMRPIFTEWIHVGPHAAIADSPVVFSLAITKATLSHFEARYDVPASATWAAGAVVGYQDDKNYEALLISSDGKLLTFTATAGNNVWNNAGSAPTSMGSGVGLITLDFGAGGAVTATVNGAASTLKVALPSHGGLALSDSHIVFHDVAWK